MTGRSKYAASLALLLSLAPSAAGAEERLPVHLCGLTSPEQLSAAIRLDDILATATLVPAEPSTCDGPARVVRIRFVAKGPGQVAVLLDGPVMALERLVPWLDGPDEGLTRLSEKGRLTSFAILLEALLAEYRLTSAALGLAPDGTPLPGPGAMSSVPGGSGDGDAVSSVPGDAAAGPGAAMSPWPAGGVSSSGPGAGSGPGPGHRGGSTGLVVRHGGAGRGGTGSVPGTGTPVAGGAGSAAGTGTPGTGTAGPAAGAGVAGSGTAGPAAGTVAAGAGAPAAGGGSPSPGTGAAGQGTGAGGTSPGAAAGTGSPEAGAGGTESRVAGTAGLVPPAPSGAGGAASPGSTGPGSASSGPAAPPDSGTRRGTRSRSVPFAPEAIVGVRARQPHFVAPELGLGLRVGRFFATGRFQPGTDWVLEGRPLSVEAAGVELGWLHPLMSGDDARVHGRVAALAERLKLRQLDVDEGASHEALDVGVAMGLVLDRRVSGRLWVTVGAEAIWAPTAGEIVFEDDYLLASEWKRVAFNWVGGRATLAFFLGR